ncbi:MAG: DUF4956 domain-containing protein [Patescibacteria group bacterium]
MFLDFYNTVATEMNAAFVVLNLFISLGLALVIVWVYRRTHRGLSYSPSMLFTLLMIGLLGTTVMMIVQQSLAGAFALLGAFALIRFRTIVKDTRDVAFVFYAIAIGVAVGMGAYATALIATVFIGSVIILLNRWHARAGSPSALNYILTFTEDASSGSPDRTSLIDSLGASANLLSIKTVGSRREYSYAIMVKNPREAERAIDAVRASAGVIDAQLISAQEVWER